MSYSLRGATAALVLLAACGFADETPQEQQAEEPTTTAGQEGAATALASGSAELPAAELEAGRLDSTWKQYVEMDPDPSADSRPGTPGDSAAEATPTQPADSAAPADSATAAADSTETWEDITPEAVNASITDLPVHGDVAGPSVARVQILLDQARFSPGVIDGRWGKNTEKAVYWFQKANGLDATGKADRATLDALAGRAAPRQVRSHTLTGSDVAGPFQELPEDVYARAEQPCLCYQSLREKLGEVFHSTPELLEQLNPGVD
ncbi:MAG: hypothetical protein GWM90_33325, partial [Gemmatimonadetes bacterium]|nr:peptidoglycan-binding protein [Gemmatimonadota bacterium]NIQ60208.1 peptidoglycan-binding protein [Gemmatimonadota bacterium]NIU80423.1 hypothetical protein [Gammaproteobacteria bacterium]NIX48760.1 hypothetical protein [Gemmatimonadota bacterium]NIY13216.1 hypothetical protein [Gemmatimonadota bacterium]